MEQIINFIGGIIPESIGALIGVLGALYIFKLQLRNEKIKQDEKTKNEEVESLKFSSLILESIITTFEKEIENLEVYQQKFENHPYMQLHQPTALATNDIKRLLKLMDESSYLSAYMNHIGSEKADLSNYNKIAKSIDYLSIIRDQIQGTVNLAIERDLNRRNLYNSNVIKNINALKDYCYDNILTHIEFLQIILPVNIVYGNDDRFNLDQHAKYLVEPIIGLIQHKFHDDKYLKSIEFELHQAIGLANHTIYNNLKFAEDIKQMINNIKRTIKVLGTNSINLIKFSL